MNIKSGIPIPPARKEHFWADLFRKMKVGDSCIIPPEREKQRGWVYQAAQNLGMKVRLRTTDEGLRLWRIQ